GANVRVPHVGDRRRTPARPVDGPILRRHRRRAAAGLRAPAHGAGGERRATLRPRPSSTMRIRVSAKPGYVGAEVSDAGRPLGDVEITSPGDRTEPVESGFGLLLVDRIATRWGTAGETGATVWFELIDTEQGENATF